MKNRKRKGNVLVVTLIILAVILMAALSMSLTSVKERRGSMSETKTNSAIQNAQTGLEMVLENIRVSSLADLTKNLKDCQDSGSYNGKIYDNTEGRFYVELYKKGTSEPEYFECNESGKTIADIYRIKSVGISQGETRAIEAGVVKKNP